MLKTLLLPLAFVTSSLFAQQTPAGAAERDIRQKQAIYEDRAKFLSRYPDQALLSRAFQSAARTTLAAVDAIQPKTGGISDSKQAMMMAFKTSMAAVTVGEKVMGNAILNYELEIQVEADRAGSEKAREMLKAVLDDAKACREAINATLEDGKSPPLIPACEVVKNDAK